MLETLLNRKVVDRTADVVEESTVLRIIDHTVYPKDEIGREITYPVKENYEVRLNVIGLNYEDAKHLERVLRNTLADWEEKTVN